MALYEITSPDGAVYQIEGPEGASDADLINAVSAHNAAAPKEPQSEIPTGRQQWGNQVLETVLPFAAGAAGMSAGPAAPWVVPAMAGAGYGLAKGIERAVGTAPPSTSPVLQSGLDVLEGTATDMTGQAAGKYIIEPAVNFGVRAAGKAIDIVKGVPAKAAAVLRGAIGANEVPASTMARDAMQQIKDVIAANAGTGKLPADILAENGINQPVLQAMLADARKTADPSSVKFFSDMLNLQQSEAKNVLAQMAGGSTQTAARASQEANVNALKAQEIPRLEGVIRNVNQRTGTALRVDRGVRAAEQQAIESDLAAAQNVDTVRRMKRFKERAPNIRPPNEIISEPRVPFRYTLASEMAKKADDVSAKAAAGSLEFGEARNFAQAAADELGAYGLKPLTSDSIISQIERMRKNVRLMPGLKDSDAVMNHVIEDFKQWSGNNGVINAWALENIRKNSVNNAIKKVVGNPDKKLEALVNSKLAPVLIDAMVNAGGKGYREYLENYSKGMQDVARQKLGAKMMELFDGSPSEFANVVRGENPTLIEDILGPGRYDLDAELGNKVAEKYRQVGKMIDARAAAGEQASGGRESFKNLMESETSLIRLPHLMMTAVTIPNQAITVLEKHMGKKVTSEIVKAAKSPEAFAELLNTYPARERNAILRTISQFPEKMRSAPGLGIATVNALDPNRKVRNALVR